ncbi:MAG: Rid family hydrolase [Pseudomonadota bacterium]
MTAIRHDPFRVDPTYNGIYAHGVELAPSSRVLLVSGQVGVAPDGTLGKSFREQFEQAIENVRAVLNNADMALSDVTRLGIFLIRRGDIETAVDIRKRHFAGVRPAITTVLVSGLVSPEWLVEVEATAVQESRQGAHGQSSVWRSHL